MDFGKSVFKETPKLDLDLDLGFVKTSAASPPLFIKNVKTCALPPINPDYITDSMDFMCGADKMMFKK